MAKSMETGVLDEALAVYNGPEVDFWELLMGRQIHIGGLVSSKDLAGRAGVEGMDKGVDFCCCTGAGMQFLASYCKVSKMTGIDASEKMVARGRQRCEAAGFSDRIEFVHGDVCGSILADNSADFIWGEDAWCYVARKDRLINEAARIVRPGGLVAFTDWICGKKAMTSDEYQDVTNFMKFPDIQSLEGYCGLLEKCNFRIIYTDYTGRFARYMRLYKNMLDMQFGFDAFRILSVDEEQMKAISGRLDFLHDLAEQKKISQGIFIAKKV